MANLTIRNLDDEVYARLKQRAKASNRSLEAELRAVLTDVSRSRVGLDATAMARQIAEMTPERSQTDSVDLLREDRRR